MDQPLTTCRHRTIRSIIGRDETFLAFGPENRGRHSNGTAGSNSQEADQVEAKEPARVQWS